MPTVFRQDGFRFFFYSNEGDLREPVHIHVLKGSAEAKFWVGNEIALARSRGFDARELRRIMNTITENRILIENRWHEHFGK